MTDRILKLLATGPLTSGQIARSMGVAEAEVRASLAHLVFASGVVTCKLDGGPARRVYVLEPPSKAFMQATR